MDGPPRSRARRTRCGSGDSNPIPRRTKRSTSDGGMRVRRPTLMRVSWPLSISSYTIVRPQPRTSATSFTVRSFMGVGSRASPSRWFVISPSSCLLRHFFISVSGAIGTCELALGGKLSSSTVSIVIGASSDLQLHINITLSQPPLRRPGCCGHLLSHVHNEALVCANCAQFLAQDSREHRRNVANRGERGLALRTPACGFVRRASRGVRRVANGPIGFDGVRGQPARFDVARLPLWLHRVSDAATPRG